MSKDRRNTIALGLGLALAAFVAGLALALWRPAGSGVPRVVGAIGIVAGVVLLTSRNLFKRDERVDLAIRIQAEQRARVLMRIMGASQILFGAAQFVPDLGVRIALTLCSAAVSVAGICRAWFLQRS